MRKAILILVFIQMMQSAKAQIIRYEKLDSISAEISKLQLEVNGNKYNFGDSEFELSFPEENFKVYYHNLLATTGIYKKNSVKELLQLNENIDFSKATGYINGITNNNVMIQRVYFPSGYLKTQFYENGVLTYTTNEDHLDFFRMNKKADKTLGYYLFDLITSIQIAKGLVTETEISNQKKDFSPNLSISEAQKFILKYPESMHNLYLKNRIKRIEEVSQQKELVVKNFIDSLCEVYKFKAGLTEAEFRNFNIDAAKIMKKKYHCGTKLPNDTYSTSDKANSTYIFFNNKGELDTYAFDIINKGNDYELKAKDKNEISENYNKMVSYLELRIPAEFIRKGINRRGSNFITVFHPKLNVEITYTTFFNNNHLSVANYSITFYSVNR